MKLEVFDPPMCCSSGVCGPNVDKKLVQFAADIEWIRKQGIEVARYNLSQQPKAFIENESIRTAIQNEGNQCLPVIVCNGRIAVKGQYPSRSKMAEIFGMETDRASLNSSPNVVFDVVAVPKPPGAPGCCNGSILTDSSKNGGNKTCC